VAVKLRAAIFPEWHITESPHSITRHRDSPDIIDQIPQLRAVRQAEIEPGNIVPRAWTRERNDLPSRALWPSKNSMKLRSFSVTNYRSITRTGKLSMGDFTVLVGPNNEGKSNILRALSIALQVVSVGQRLSFRNARSRLLLGRPVSSYDWEADFPSNLRDVKPGGKSRFELEFELTGNDGDSFREATGSVLLTPLRVVIEFGRTGTPSIDVVIQGPAKKKLASKKTEIARFLSATLDFSYIPAVRQADWATGITSDIIDRELDALHETPEFKRLQGQIQTLERPVLESIGRGVRKTLAEFIPEVKDVSIKPDDSPRWNRPSSRDYLVLVDDGHVTQLERKGDGMQSLAAIALMHQTSESRASGRGLIFAVEEPESHLHAEAIHRLRLVLEEISRHSQIVITTHSAALVNRQQIANNILVQTSVARKAASLQEIREALGVRVSDNLVAADLILLVEGEEDVKLMGAILDASSAALAESRVSGRLALDSMGGASNLTYDAFRYKRLACNVHAFVDDDDSARAAVEKSRTEGALELTEINVASCPGRDQSEIEDLLSIETYKDRVRDECGLDVDVAEFRGGKEKWSSRVRSLLKAQGRSHLEVDVTHVKAVTHSACESQPGVALDQHLRGAFDALRSALERRLGYAPV
jgi:putative ATP-dependent endonuclease of the OLD family